MVTIGEFFQQPYYEKVTLADINKGYYFSIGSFDICSICNHAIHGQEDLQSLKRYCHKINKYLQRYITPDPTHIITSYIAEPGYICQACRIHYDEVKKYVTKQFNELLKTTKYHYPKVYIGIEDFRSRESEYLSYKNGEAYLKFKVGKHHLRCRCELRIKDIFEILLEVGAIEKLWAGDSEH